MAKDFGNVLVSSASSKVPMIEAARDALYRVAPASRILAGDIDPAVPSAYVADGFVLMPKLNQMSIAQLVYTCQERGITTILPSRDGELQFWADNKGALADKGVHVVVSPSATIRTCVDKLEFAHFGQRHGLPIIPAALTPDKIAATHFVVKERYGAGSRRIALRVQAADLGDAATRLIAPIYQPYIEGIEISVDAWMNRDHRLKGLVLRRRDRVVGGESVITTTFRDAAIESVVAAVLDLLKLSGHAVLQVLLNDDGLHIIECNARFGGASTASIAVGLDTFFWTFSELNGDAMDGLPFIRIAGELRQVRVQRDIHVACNRI